MRVYISGPISRVRDGNREAFERVSVLVTRSGHGPSNPHEFCADLDPETTSWETYMRRCVAVLASCDAVVLLPGWLGSRGAMLEFNLASDLGMPTFEVSEWETAWRNGALPEALRGERS